MNHNTLSSLGLIVLMIVFMYFFMIRPQQRQRKAHQSMMSKLKKGDHVVTISRLHGVVYDIDQAKRTVTLDCEGIYLTFDLGAIMRVNSQASGQATTKADKPAAKEEKPAAKEDQPADKQEATESADSADDQKPAAAEKSDDAKSAAEDQEAK